ncbi:FeoA family protein [Leptothoe sp. LEGE 181152]|uniref:Ferrous iron transport protein A n=1 Tax=Adonisia turfae CCMR0081 TaxID=2292702 RepID=A0A6M0RG52_9CYAN|nr:FeoA family protein [Adonisia turfae]MDV3349841.1 FeoA family protein [Leptothoe sp. LEGE 181152]NEZ54833.1 ferrous iron transport protein A [Adonisia turfae CCMR0081]
MSDSIHNTNNGWNVTYIGGTADLQEPPSDTEMSEPGHGSRLPLAMATVGDRVWIAQLNGGQSMVRRLTEVGIVPGKEITVASRTGSGSVVVALQGCRIGLGAGMAHRVMVTTANTTNGAVSRQPTQSINGENDMTSEIASLTLSDLKVGQSGRVLGYQPGSQTYRGKLLSMGLTPGAQFVVVRQAPMGDPMEINVRGMHLSLRKGEAAVLQVEVIEVEEECHG